MKKVILKIGGMTCSACSYGLEKYLLKQKGIKSVSVNLILAIAIIEYEDIKVNDIEIYIKKAGFKSLGKFKNFDNQNSKKDFYSLIIMGLILIIFMLLAMYLEKNIVSYILIFLISIIYLFYGKDILKSGILSLYNKTLNMDTLVLLSVSASFLYSLYGLIKILLGGNAALYFESVCMVIYFIKLGGFIEHKSRNKTKDAIKELVQITPKEALLKKDNKEISVTIDEIKVDDILICKPGEKIAVDGVVLNGKTYVDESFITGESKPILKEVGDYVIAGSISYDGSIEYQAKKIGSNSTISEIIKLVVSATNNRSKIQTYTDKVSGYFVYAIIFVAIMTLVVQLIIGSSINDSLMYFATVLVVACPCALGLAVPLVMVVSNGLCAKKGLFVRSSEIFELANSIDTIIFDKTGTLTYGKLGIEKFYNYSEYSDDELINIVSNIEDKSSHPIKTAFKVNEKLEVEDFRNVNGYGISATINNQKYYLGNKDLLKKIGISDFKEEDYNKLLETGSTIIYVIEDNKVIGLIGVKDIIRDEFKKVIEMFKEQKIEVCILTGDNYESAKVVADSLGIEKIYANKTPEEKSEIVEKMINQKKNVMMVGDGINDAISLVKATIGVSINDGTDIAKDASDVILMNNNIKNILDLLKISKYSYKIIKQNLFWAFFYNILMLPLAAGLFSKYGVTINPMIASIAMTLSSLCVVINSLRLRRKFR